MACAQADALGLCLVFCAHAVPTQVRSWGALADASGLCEGCCPLLFWQSALALVAVRVLQNISCHKLEQMPLGYVIGLLWSRAAWRVSEQMPMGYVIAASHAFWTHVGMLGGP